MFSGKTAALIERLATARAAGQRVVAIKHRLDTRYDPQQLATHDGRFFPARSCADAAALAASAADADVIGVDEAQFFGRPLAAVCRAWAARGRRIIVAGIDHDAWGQPFPPLPEIATFAAESTILHARCGACGGPARYSQRMVPVVAGQMVGGPAEYEPRCAACFRPLPPPAPVY